MSKKDNTSTTMLPVGKKQSQVKHLKWAIPVAIGTVAGAVPLGFAIYALANPTPYSDLKMVENLKAFNKSIADEFIFKDGQLVPNADYLKFITAQESVPTDVRAKFNSKYPDYENAIVSQSLNFKVKNVRNEYSIFENESTNPAIFNGGYDLSIYELFGNLIPNYLQTVSERPENKMPDYSTITSGVAGSLTPPTMPDYNEIVVEKWQAYQIKNNVKTPTLRPIEPTEEMAKAIVGNAPQSPAVPSGHSFINYEDFILQMQNLPNGEMISDFSVPANLINPVWSDYNIHFRRDGEIPGNVFIEARNKITNSGVPPAGLILPRESMPYDEAYMFYFKNNPDTVIQAYYTAMENFLDQLDAYNQEVQHQLEIMKTEYTRDLAQFAIYEDDYRTQMAQYNEDFQAWLEKQNTPLQGFYTKQQNQINEVKNGFGLDNSPFSFDQYLYGNLIYSDYGILSNLGTMSVYEKYCELIGKDSQNEFVESKINSMLEQYFGVVNVTNESKIIDFEYFFGGQIGSVISFEYEVILNDINNQLNPNGVKLIPMEISLREDRLNTKYLNVDDLTYYNNEDVLKLTKGGN